jgi:hypothetical protein
MTRDHARRTSDRLGRDRGAVLPLVLVIGIVLAVLVTSLATYAATGLRYGSVTADRSDRLSAADGGLRYAIDQLKLRNTRCLGGATLAMPGNINGAPTTIGCQRTLGSGEVSQAWAAVLTGAGLPPSQFLVSTQGGSVSKILDGPIWMSRVNLEAFEFKNSLTIENGPLNYYDNGSCSEPFSLPDQIKDQINFQPALVYGPSCVDNPWTITHQSPAFASDANLSGLPTRRGDIAFNPTNKLFALSHITGNIVAPNNAVGESTETWAGTDNANVSGTSRWLMAPPNGSLTVGGIQTVKVVARKGTNTGNPTVTVSLFEDGVLRRTLVDRTPVTDSTPRGQTLTATFSTSDIIRPDKVEIQIVISGVGGGRGVNNSAQIDTIEWEADLEVTGDGSYQDFGACRVFLPGRYVRPPAMAADRTQNPLAVRGVYFRPGNYIFDLPGPEAVIDVRAARVTAGTAGPPGESEIPNPDCQKEIDKDPPGAGATFYMSGPSHIVISDDGSLEIHARRQRSSFVSVQALCDPASSWCTNPLLTRPEPNSGAMVSTLEPTITQTNVPPAILYTRPGDNKQFVTHGLVYAPLAKMEFGNVSAGAVQKVLGGLVVSRVILQSSNSSKEFVVRVSPRPIDSEIQLTSTAVKNGATSVRAVVQYRPNNLEINNRVRVNSWRVCETAGCS